MEAPITYLGDDRFTYADYLEWDGPERWELDDGLPVLMSPAPTVFHQTIVVRLAATLLAFLKGKRSRVLVSPLDVLFPEADEPDEEVRNLLQPDVVVVCDEGKLQRRNVRGAPDLAIEVLSGSSRVRDRTIKRARYERFGVREYWIVDPEERTVEVLVRDDATGAFAAPGAEEPGAAQGPAGGRVWGDEAAAIPVATLAGLSIDARELFAPV